MFYCNEDIDILNHKHLYRVFNRNRSTIKPRFKRSPKSGTKSDVSDKIKTITLYTILVIIKFKNVLHSLVPDETPSNSASHQALNYVQRS